ncbi:hypothetical protein BLA60_14550 [Actinophytocola xinjiangensis]|uniref:HTH cro/C1-type domain-containing protein n=1 Tax=Actinophytocola xinjiangensis TaxID=485602 RepID=A0A7Z0WN04_9PSEU|nr:helix-turn-helix transcriptional regulator [Actinophytocola xinjiangensis]OLF11192.1 hypothetical protein BLA60_14550 [Actinophytocola xinjiangensis]
MDSFGAALRRLRKAAGLSQPQLAKLVPISQSSLSRYETGRQAADQATIDRLEELLDGNGALSALAHRPAQPDDPERLQHVVTHPRSVDPEALASLARLLAESRRLEDRFGPWLMVGPAVGYVRLLERLTSEARGPLRSEVVDLAAQWAQFTGWLHAATDQGSRAAHWFDRTLEWSAESNNPTLTANALSYKGHLAWMTGRTGPMIGLSHAARRNPDTHVSQRAFDAMQEARGHAMAGDLAAADRTLGLATDLAAQVPDAGNPPAWSYFYAPAFWTLQQGLVHRYFPTRHESAAELLRSGIAALPHDQQSAEWLGDYRRALEFVQPT